MAEDGSREQAVLGARRESLEHLRAKGIEPFAFGFEFRPGIEAAEPTPSAAIRERHGGMAPARVEDVRYGVAGRVVFRRSFGNLVFLILRDREGDLQVVCDRANLLGGDFELLEDVDLGDLVGAYGRVGTTKRGELSIFAERLAMLSKALRPLPEKWHGLRDPDLQQRQRYLHLATDLEYRRVVRARAATLRAFRSVLDERGFVEVETPVLQPSAGGAIARPFVTHHEALDIDLYLRIALELYLKRLLVGGLERVYEIGHNFRNEGIDREHNPEFTMLEVYQAYADYFAMMELGEALIREAALAVRGSLRFTYRGRDLDLESEWRRTTMLELVSEATGVEVTLDRPDLRELAGARGIEVHPSWGPGKVILELYESLVEGDLWQPTWVLDLPREVSPLARPHRSAPGLVEHADLVIGGMEIIPAYSELSDPDEQRRSFEIQAEARRRGEEETHPMDEDFLTALEHGMPPAGGFGLGVDRLLMILADASSIRDVILFPHMRPED
jgi:lysyl-tRNA synthetase class 2